MTDINRELCEVLGIKWHEPTIPYDKAICSCGARYCYAVNPDFTDDAGAVQLLRLMMQREDWAEFIQSLFAGDIVHTDQVASMIEDYITTPGLLARAALEWLRKETK